MSTSEVVKRERVVDGRRVRILECDGGGPVVVLVHGLGLAAGCWRPHLPILARAGFRVIAPDLPGFGQSEGPRSGYSVPDTAEWLERFAAAEALTGVAWVGHSLSAQVLLRFAARHPERTSAMVLAAPTGDGRGWRRAGAQLIGLATDAFHERPRLVVSIIRRYLSAPIATTKAWLRARNHRPESDAAAVGCPVLMVLGDDDPVVDVQFARGLARRISDVRLRVIANAAHAVALDPADAFSEMVRSFLLPTESRSRPPAPERPVREAG